MTAHSEYCRCRRCIEEGIEAADPERAEIHADDEAEERAERHLAYLDGATRNYPEDWRGGPW